jgi:hypothetical protein
MTLPNGWSVYDDGWWIKQVQVTDDRWLLMFYNFNNIAHLPVGWINITTEEWHPNVTDKKPMSEMYLKEFSLQQGSLLELECIEREWTEEILRTQVLKNTP